MGGFVEFLWYVTGSSRIKLDPASRFDGYRVDELEALAILSSSEDVPAQSISNDQSGQPGTSVDSDRTGIFDQQVFAVDWFAGQEFDVFFQLATVSRLDIFNLDAAGFDAEVDANFSNTASLQHIRVYDNNGNLLPGARLMSTDSNGPDYSSLSSVPEPSSIVFGMLLTTVARFVSDGDVGESHEMDSLVPRLIVLAAAC